MVKLNASGSALLYSTYLGGNGDEAGNDLALDSEGAHDRSCGSDGLCNYTGGVEPESLDLFVSKLIWNGTILSLGYSS